MNTEPVAIAGAIQVLIGAVIALLVAFNAWNPTPDQTGAIFGLYAALVAIFTIIVRGKVTPTGGDA